MKYIISLLFCLLIVASVHAQKRIACVGASITEGACATDPKKDSYPAQLGSLLGNEYKVLNFELGSRTILRKGDFPYWETEQYKKALASNPDIVFIDLGGNDAKIQNRIHMDEMERDCIDMIKSFKQLPSNPRIILMLPLTSFEPDTTQIWDAVIVNKIIPSLRRAAYKEGIEVLDMHPLLINRKDLMPDNIHPDNEGAAIIARRLFEQVILKTDKDFDILSNIKVPYTTSDFSGYICADQDEAVSPTQTLLFEEKIKAQGGDITVMMKHGFKHHPHSFPNPSPIVDFVLKATYK